MLVSCEKILGYTVLVSECDRGGDVNIRHIVVERSSQWVIRRNVIPKTNILQIDRNVAQFLIMVRKTIPASLSVID